MNVVLVDEDDCWADLLPLTFTRPVSELPVGIFSIREKWNRYMGRDVAIHARPHLQGKFPSTHHGDVILVASNILPGATLIGALEKLEPGQALVAGARVVAYRGKDWFDQGAADKVLFKGEVKALRNTWDIFRMCGEEMKKDFELLTYGRKSGKLDPSLRVVGNADRIFLAKGASATASCINTTDGPVYIGKDAEVMEGSMIRGPFALGDYSTVKMGAKIYGPTSIGPHCKIGGEISNCVMLGYSNKAHDGFLGNSVIGEWCNLGADTNNSNLKNNYSNVKVYNYQHRKPVDSGLQFCGLIMGDHSKSGINTMFNTGTVVGVGCNIFGGGFPPTYIPNFSWGGAEKIEPYKIEKLVETAEKVFERRGLKFGEADRELIDAINKLAV